MLHKIRTTIENNQPAVGFIDSRGSVVVPPTYDDVQAFREGRAGVHFHGGGKGIIDEAGKVIAGPEYRQVGDYSEGRCAVLTKSPELWGFVDDAGRLVISANLRQQFPLFDYPYFSEGLCAVPSADGYMWGYIDCNGKLVIPYQFKFAWSFSDGLAPVEDATGRAGYIEKSGAFAFDARWAKTFPFRNGLAAVANNNLWGIINKQGESVLEP